MLDRARELRDSEAASIDGLLADLTERERQLDSLLEQLVEQLDSLTAPGLASVAVHDESHVPQQADSDRAPALASSVFSAESQATRARAQQQKAMFRKRFIEWDSSGGYNREVKKYGEELN